MTRILYLVHDLDDPAVWRRVAMLEAGGASLRIAGFRRGDAALPREAEVLGHTRDARLVHRAWAVLRQVPAARSGRLAAAGRGGDGKAEEVDVILARNLEMLALAAMLARRMPRARLVYELLDIHGTMLGTGPASRGLRRVEAWALRRAALVVISSPAFRRCYLEPQGLGHVPALLVENRITWPGGSRGFGVPALRKAPVQAGRLTIGWFGILRCAWSLATLDAVTRASPGRYRVRLRGRPALAAIPDFHAVVEGNPDLDYLGPYRWPDDLADAYAEVDLAWLVDRFQAGRNSDWLLPNRLYESGRFGAVPVALAGTETAHRLQELGIGVMIEAADTDAVSRALKGVDDAMLAGLRVAVGRLPVGQWEAGPDAGRRLVAALAGGFSGGSSDRPVPRHDAAGAAEPDRKALP